MYKIRSKVPSDTIQVTKSQPPVVEPSCPSTTAASYILAIPTSLGQESLFTDAGNGYQTYISIPPPVVPSPSDSVTTTAIATVTSIFTVWTDTFEVSVSLPPGLLPTVTTLLPLRTSAARTFFHLTPSFATSLDSAAGIPPTVQHTYSSPSSPIFVIASTGSHNSCLSPIPPQPSAQETQQNAESRLRGADVAALVIGMVIVGLLAGVAAACLYI
ncbi:hypothetical protein PG995_008919 [Apiospora arundinis]|uniref:Uncharacterized protein n=1 Tax=Apiospora arundinis TaxID=335852 RepID=A0ABR2JMD2_9PEZI